jgi:hypothetical protein
MNTNKGEVLLLKAEVFQIVGCALQTRMGEDCLVKFVSIRVHSWLMNDCGESNRLA